MIEFISTLPDYGSDTATSTIWEKIRPHLEQYDGICFYKYPIIQTASKDPPDLTIISHSIRPVIVRCLSYGIDDIDEIDTDVLVVDNKTYDSPLLELEDLSIELANKFERERTLRKRTQRGDLSPVRILGLPLIRRHEFEAKFAHLNDETHTTVVLFLDDTGQSVAQSLDHPLEETEWQHVFSNIQGVNTIRTPSRHAPHEAPTLGDAIKILERNIALLDEGQVKAALQIAPGPQRIRGLAGTAKQCSWR